MLFNSLHFMIFFPIVVLLYFAIPRKMRCIWLLIASYYFYMSWNAKYAILIAFSTLITYGSGLLIDKTGNFELNKEKQIRYKKYVVAASLLINLGILFFFKYFTFALENINALLSNMHVQLIQNPFDFILPVGISFYTFQALGYTIDVYRGDIKAERSFVKYALFVSFFPQLVAGPIERSGNLLSQIDNVEKQSKWNYARVTEGLITMIWGFFMKMVIADRAAVLVNTVFDSYYMFDSFELITASVFFTIQIYCDFASYSTIAIGAAQVLGFGLMENFDTPYLSNSIKDFWRRWHISLSTWFRDYLYIPLGGSRCSKWKKYRNLMITFLVSGMWHGANWTYVVWGGIHGIYQIIGAELQPVKKMINQKLHTKENSFSYRLGQITITFCLVDFAWIFFRANSISQAFEYIERIATRWNPWILFNGGLYELGLNQFEMHVFIVALIALILIDLLKYKTNLKVQEFLREQCIWFRWGAILLGIATIFIYGQYGEAFDAQAFIYFQF